MLGLINGNSGTKYFTFYRVLQVLNLIIKQSDPCNLQDFLQLTVVGSYNFVNLRIIVKLVFSKRTRLLSIRKAKVLLKHISAITGNYFVIIIIHFLLAKGQDLGQDLKPAAVLLFISGNLQNYFSV